MTVKVLKALDFVVPGEWENVVGCDRTIEFVTGESDGDRIRDICNRAIELYNDSDRGYQSALWFYLQPRFISTPNSKNSVLR